MDGNRRRHHIARVIAGLLALAIAGAAYKKGWFSLPRRVSPDLEEVRVERPSSVHAPTEMPLHAGRQAPDSKEESVESPAILEVVVVSSDTHELLPGISVGVLRDGKDSSLNGAVQGNSRGEIGAILRTDDNGSVRFYGNSNDPLKIVVNVMKDSTAQSVSVSQRPIQENERRVIMLATREDRSVRLVLGDRDMSHIPGTQVSLIVPMERTTGYLPVDASKVLRISQADRNGTCIVSYATWRNDWIRIEGPELTPVYICQESLRNQKELCVRLEPSSTLNLGLTWKGLAWIPEYGSNVSAEVWVSADDLVLSGEPGNARCKSLGFYVVRTASFDQRGLAWMDGLASGRNVTLQVLVDGRRVRHRAKALHAPKFGSSSLNVELTNPHKDLTRATHER